MNEIEFNLLEEPWIIVLKEDGTTDELSVIDVFRQAHEIKSITGESSSQDIAILRLLIAIQYCVYYRTDSNGKTRMPEDEEEAVEIWTEIWERGEFDISMLKEYLIEYRDRFWLFHPRYPFYQAPIDRGTSYGTPKLIGDLSESGNKSRLFSNRSGQGKMIINYGEAARWLIHLNAFDDTSSKPSIRNAGLPSTGAGWLGKIGLIYSEGSNLFETLMLNFVMTDYNNQPFPDGKATWEVEPSVEERVEISTPESPVEILTLQSRRILIERSDEGVVGYLLMGGDIVQRENALIEQMTVWTKTKNDEWIPKRHDPTRQMWRDYSAIISSAEGTLKPGIVRWASILVKKGLFPYDYVTFRTAGVKYANKDFFAEDLINDGMIFSSNLMNKAGEIWNVRITDAIERTDKCVIIFGKYAEGLSIEGGNAPKGGNAKSAYKTGTALAYYSIDGAFRNWLHSIDPDKDDEEIKLGEWMEKIYEIIVNELGKKLLRESGVKAFVGRDMNNNSFSRFRWLRNSVRKVMRGE